MTEEEKILGWQKYIETLWKSGQPIVFSNKYYNYKGICNPYDGYGSLLWSNYDYFPKNDYDYDLGI